MRMWRSACKAAAEGEQRQFLCMAERLSTKPAMPRWDLSAWSPSAPFCSPRSPGITAQTCREAVPEPEQSSWWLVTTSFRQIWAQSFSSVSASCSPLFQVPPGITRPFLLPRYVHLASACKVMQRRQMMSICWVQRHLNKGWHEHWEFQLKQSWNPKQKQATLSATKLKS